ncbi:MAG: site-specific recombinase [Proteobacteria bacterium]|nr:site-specific recombinase [Pseudomonadota bacterium]
MNDQISTAVACLARLIDRVRPADPEDVAAATQALEAETARLRARPEEARAFRDALLGLLTQPNQLAFYAETGVPSALGFWLELSQRIQHKLLPPVMEPGRLRDQMLCIFHAPYDHLWVSAIPDEIWSGLIMATGPVAPLSQSNGQDLDSLLDTVRALSYRLAGVALDRELLQAEPALEEFESPFLAQNATLVRVLERVRAGGAMLDAAEVRDMDVLLDQCDKVIERIRRRARENGISVRLSYLLSRMLQLIARLRQVLDLIAAESCLAQAVPLFKTLLQAAKNQRFVRSFIADNVGLLARNMTDSASRQGEHYIAADRAEWWDIARSAAGGGIIIALMALLKIQLALLHLPPLTEAFAFSLNYGLGFVLIHLLGFTVATKQPAMTAASIAAVVEASGPRELDKLCALVQNVIRTQFIAVLGNVGLALPLACLIAGLWPLLFAAPLAPAGKIASLLGDIHPTHSAALLFAAVAGIGLFLSGLVSGYFDNRVRYRHLAPRIAQAPLFLWLGEARAVRLGNYLDTHIGAILGNLFFGFYLGMAGAVSVLTGLPIDIRHVAFSSANLGTAVTTLGFDATREILPWAISGVIGIAAINLFVSFSLALYVAMKSRRLGAQHMLHLGGHVLRRFLRQPLSFVLPPRKATETPEQ